MTIPTITLCIQLLIKELTSAIDYRDIWKDIPNGEPEVKQAEIYICNLEKAIEELNNELK
jgi:hypothetical protein